MADSISPTAPKLGFFDNAAKTSGDENAKKLVSSYSAFYQNTYQRDVQSLAQQKHDYPDSDKDPNHKFLKDTAQAEVAVAADIATLHSMQLEISKAVGDSTLRDQLANDPNLLLTDTGTTTTKDMLQQAGVAKDRVFTYQGIDNNDNPNKDGSKKITASTKNISEKTVTATSAFQVGTAGSSSGMINESSSVDGQGRVTNWTATNSSNQTMTGGSIFPTPLDQRSAFNSATVSDKVLSSLTANQKANAFCYYSTLSDKDKASYKKGMDPESLKCLDKLTNAVKNNLGDNPGKDPYGWNNFNNIYNAFIKDGAKVK